MFIFLKSFILPIYFFQDIQWLNNHQAILTYNRLFWGQYKVVQFIGDYTVWYYYGIPKRAGTLLENMLFDRWQFEKYNKDRVSNLEPM